MKVAVVLLAISGVVMSQRPYYAGSRRPYPEVQPWFTTPTTTSADLGDRFNQPATPSTTTERLPIDAYGDRELFNQIATWPREKWPFWYLNWQLLEQARNRTQPGQQPQQQSGTANRFGDRPIDNAPAFAPPPDVPIRSPFLRP